MGLNITAQKHYWVGLLVIVKKLCRYYLKWKHKLPTDLPQDVILLLSVIEAACTALEAYDRGHQGGLE